MPETHHNIDFSTQQLIFTRGLPGSGKSTLASKMVGESAYLHNPDGARTGDLKYRLVRVNRDDLRSVHPKWKRGKFNYEVEKEVLRQRDEAVKAALDAGLSVISDDTNLGPKYASHWSSIAKKYGIPVVMIDFIDPNSEYFVSVDKCIKQDLLRDASVGRDVILKMYYANTPIDAVDPEVLTYLPDAVIMDLDGTLAHMNDRGPYDDTKYDTDSIDESLLWFLKTLTNTKILIVSGREATQIAETQTINWLKNHNVPYDYLWMRKCGDHRTDDVVKLEIYNTKIKFNFNVRLVFDDRKRVARMWETQGLKVMRCGPEFDFDMVK